MNEIEEELLLLGRNNNPTQRQPTGPTQQHRFFIPLETNNTITTAETALLVFSCMVMLGGFCATPFLPSVSGRITAVTIGVIGLFFAVIIFPCEKMRRCLRTSDDTTPAPAALNSPA